MLNQFFKPTSYPLASLEKQHLETGTSFYIQIHDRNIRCWKWGQGPSILFVYGWNGRGVNFAHFFNKILDAGYSVITYDATAHGQLEGQVTNYFELTDTVRPFFKPPHEFNIQGIIAHSIGASAVINRISKENPFIDVALIAPALKLKEILFNAFHRHSIYC